MNEYDVNYYIFSPLEKVLLSVVGMCIGIVLIFMGVKYRLSIWMYLLYPGVMIFMYSGLVCVENMKYFGCGSEEDE